jgi:hypothetical protein
MNIVQSLYHPWLPSRYIGKIPYRLTDVLEAGVW